MSESELLGIYKGVMDLNAKLDEVLKGYSELSANVRKVYKEDPNAHLKKPVRYDLRAWASEIEDNVKTTRKEFRLPRSDSPFIDFVERLKNHINEDTRYNLNRMLVNDSLKEMRFDYV